jgi:hypothetical protein
MIINNLQALIISLLLVLTVFSCKKDDVKPAYAIPTTYNFTNADFSDVSKRLVMIAQIEALMNSDNQASGIGVFIDSAILKNMFANTGNPFAADSLNKSGLQLKDRATPATQTNIQHYFQSVSASSLSTSTPTKGTAGMAVTQTSTYILLNENGVNNRQMFSKTVMGGLLANQIINLVSSSLDNSTVTTGEGTAMEHAWDEAFGYFNVPKDFPSNVTGLKYLGSYCNQVNGGTNLNKTFMDAFLAGRAAISNKDMVTKNAQANLIIKQLELLIAAGAIHEIAETKATITDKFQTVSHLSECMGFVLALQYFSNRIITDAQINTLYGTYLHNGQLYDITTDDMNNIVSTLAAIYNFTSPDKI